MITYLDGDIFQADVEALVNPVNVKEGVMGKGLAKLFAARYPEIVLPYKEACLRGSLVIGNVQLLTLRPGAAHKWVINFPTKYSWKEPSKYSYIKEGLMTLRTTIQNTPIRSIAVPALGCDNGKLEWEKVKRLEEEYLSYLDGVDVRIYLPKI